MPEDTPSEFIKGLGLTGRSEKRLAQNGIETARDFMALDKETVLGWKQTGATVWKEISEAQDKIDEVDETVAPQDEPWDPLLGPPPSPKRSEPEPEPEPKRTRRRKTEDDVRGDTVLGLLDWAIDAAAYDKKMCRDLIIRAKKMIAG